MKKIAVIFGTRPDTIKQAPIILRLQQEKKHFQVLSIATAQHRSMLDQVLKVFGITPDYDLDIMQPKQSLATLTRNIITAVDDVLVKESPDMVLVQGDTTTTIIGSLAAFYRQIPVGHVEAGLRTNDRSNPFPEEINRRLTGCIADLHFAPTATAKKALLRENVDPKTVFVTGNTVIDALQIAVRKKYAFSLTRLNTLLQEKKRIVLLTMHRRENWGEPMRGACEAVRELAIRYPEINFIFPVHLNPIVREVVYPILDPLKNVQLIEPLDYLDFVNLLAASSLVITDSGGVQEEGPALGKPILVLRTVTERPEAVRYGTVKLVGLDANKIVSSARRLLDNKAAYRKMASAVNPYGDGKAAERTVGIIKNYFGISKHIVKEFSPR
ncbi:MAG: UDP-N-acetylglucosamine 2-epimerase (non-hydrolyzing) [Ignavibacteriales bacterium]|nr:UDP-N-acetylglucosamine 2-epimerase (non-hydrolyzing) [Ignavibacteriales bacterium]